MTDTVEIDLTYVISEVQDIHAEMEAALGTNGTLTQRIEGIEARLKELGDALFEYSQGAASNPHATVARLKSRLINGKAA